ncbi:MAG TPA: class I SAM-dependent methyltransferase [Beijerinckiaceae bacterium]|jgi:phosphatidylethanolamine/phosphatidyl-N-methylethanolamine N-methyltransferase|nr:SAM-dependent methyltransferase [Microvirga sp.]HZB37566.1 class I SAM-dependent methyltransferase [Beijerinckiaceae bacterium]
MSSEELEGQRRAYARWAPIYDAVYHRFLADAHRRTAAAAARAGPDILEVGVGTGLVLSHYPPHARVSGVDLSEPMLRKAAEKVREKSLAQVRLIAAMDAGRLGFRDGAFDAVALPFVITLVPEPEAALDECARVLKPGGEIVIASKLGYDTGVQARLEEAIDPVMKRIGWSAAFKISRIEGWARRRGGFEVLAVEPLFPAGLFKLIRLRKAG